MRYQFGNKQITLIESNDAALIRPILESQKDKLFEDGQSCEGYIPNKRDIWLIGYNEENEIVGFSRFGHMTSICTDYHLAVRPEQRVYAKYLVQASFKWLEENTPYRKIVASIPMTEKSTINFAVKRIGFMWEGVNQRAWVKNNHVHDIVNLGYWI